MISTIPPPTHKTVHLSSVWGGGLFFSKNPYAPAHLSPHTEVLPYKNIKRPQKSNTQLKRLTPEGKDTHLGGVGTKWLSLPPKNQYLWENLWSFLSSLLFIVLGTFLAKSDPSGLWLAFVISIFFFLFFPWGLLFLGAYYNLNMGEIYSNPPPFLFLVLAIEVFWVEHHKIGPVGRINSPTRKRSEYLTFLFSF